MIAGLSQRIKELRKANGWSQKKLAEKLNVDRATVSNYECEIRLPDLTAIIKLSAIFKTSSGYLLGIAPQQTFDILGLTENEIHALNLTASLFRQRHGKDKEF